MSRQRILDSMLETVGTEGYEAATVRNLLDRTGVYRKTFYSNFPSKSGCYLEAFDNEIAQLEARAVATALPAASWVERLEAGLATILDYLDERPHFGRALFVEVHAAGPEALRKRSAAIERAAGFISLAANENGERSSPAIAPEAVVSGIHSVIHSRLSSPETGSFRQLLPEFMFFAVLPYFGPEAARGAMRSARA